MSANFTPELSGYNNPGTFRFWCQKTLPLVYDDSLSYYELLCKVVSYINNLIEDNRATIENVDALREAYISLQDYVNDYFDNLDVTQEISDKIDEMAADGTLLEILEPVTNELTQYIRDQATLQQAYNEATRIQTQAMVGHPFTAASAADMTDTTKIYVYTGTTGGGLTNGHWYYWNGSAWTDGGVYNAVAVTTDKTLSVADMAADAKAVGDDLSEYIKNAISYEAPIVYTIPGAGILADGTIYELAATNVYVAVVKGFDSISVSRGDLYSLFTNKPAMGSKGNGRVMMAGAATVTIPDGYGYIAVRDTQQPVFACLDTDTILAQVKNLTGIASTFAVQGFGRSITPENITSDLTDLNNIGSGYRNNTVMRFAQFTSANAIANAPVTPFNGTIVSLSVSSTSIFAIQFAFEERTDNSWYRYFIAGFEDTYGWTRLSGSDAVTVSTAAELFAALRNNRGGTINIMPGTYNLYTGLYEPLILSDTVDYAWITKDTVINGSGALVHCRIPQAVAEAHTLAANMVSIIDIKGNVTVNDLSLDCINTRYCIHYESLADTAARFNNVEINNCHFTYTRNVSNLNASCIGIGANAGQRFNIKNCTFTNDIKYGIYIHGRDYGMGCLNIENCIINATHAGGVFLSQYTGLQTPIDVYVVNSNVGTIIVGGQPGGTGVSQYRLFVINSGATITVDDVTVLYPPTVITTV